MSSFKFTATSMLQMLEEDKRSTEAKEKAFLEQKVQFLNQVIAEYAKREDDNKKINSMLIDLLSGKEAESLKDKQTQLAVINNELREELNSTKRMHSQIAEHYESQIKTLKEEILQKQRERVGCEAKYQQQISQLQTKLSNYIGQNLELQKKLEQSTQQQTDRKETITSNMREVLLSTINNYQTGQITRRQPELKNVSSIQSRVNSLSDVFKSSGEMDIENNINEANVREERVKSYRKKPKSQIKMMMSTLLKAKGKLEQGYQNVTYMAQRQSLGRTGNKQSKSFYH